MRRLAGEILMVARELGASDLNMAYDSRLFEVSSLSREFQKQLNKHYARQRRNPMTEKFVTDLDNVKQRLEEMMRELG